ncbi:MAG: family 43 glycosylhydrolase [Bacteroidota bacterium]
MKKLIHYQAKNGLLARKAWLLSFSLCITMLAAQAQTFQNPVREGAADPFITYYNGFYYMTYTTIDHLEIVKASSLADMRHAQPTWVFTSGGDNGKNIWAPELHRINGPNGFRWYLYYTAGAHNCCENQRMHVLESVVDDPMGPYEYKAQLYFSMPNKDVYAIDGSIFQRPNGSLYYLYTTEHTASLRIASMSNPWTMSSEGVEIARPKYDWETMSGFTNEGPIALQRNGRIFITYSGNQCGSPDYAIGLLTADENSNLLDARSWNKSPDAIFKKAPEKNVYGTGHHGVFRSACGEDWLVYHAVSNFRGACDGSRSARAQKITWNADGTPNFGVPEATGVDLPLPSGDSRAGGSCVAEAKAPFPGPNPAAIPGVVEAENFDKGPEGISYHDTTPANLIGPFRSNTGVDTEPCTEGGNNLAFSDNGEWLEYTVNVATAGVYTMDARVASPVTTGRFHIEMDGTNVTGALVAPNTGGWQTWQNVSKIVNLTAGKHIMRFVIDAKEFNINKFTFTAPGIPPVQTPYALVIALPGTVEAENFDNGGEGVAYHDTEEANLGGIQRPTGPDVFTCVSSEGSNALGWINNGEWIEYMVNADSAGSYTINARIASVFNTGVFHLEWDGVNISGAIAVPNTGDWQAWQSVTKTVTLTAGPHILRVFFDAGNFNLNKITFGSTGGGTDPFPSGGVYRLVNRQSGKVLDVNECSLNNGMKVQQWPWLGGNCQRWKLTATDNGYYKLTAQHSGQALEIGAALQNPGAKANQWPSNDCTCQQWKIERTDGGFYKLTARHSTQVLEVGNALMSDGAQVNQFPWNSAACQQWAIEPVPAFARQGVEEVAQEMSLQLEVFPNPAENVLHIRHHFDKATPVSIQLLDVLAKPIIGRNETAPAGVYETELDIHSAKSGIYILKVQMGKFLVTRKVIINN